MGHAHHHPATTATRLSWALGLTVIFVFAEGAVGCWSGSLALLSDAGHNLADALAIGLAWYAHAIASRAADSKRTYGYHRVGVLAALANALVLVVISAAILVQAWHRLQQPAIVPGLWIMLTAGVALVMNSLISWWLHRDSAHDVNLRSAYLHMLGDAAASAGVIIAGAIVYFSHWNAADALASILIAVLILWSSWTIVQEVIGILLEAAPSGLDMVALAKVINGVPGVRGVHDLHAWTLGSGIVACSCHILVDEQSASSGQEIQRLVAEVLAGYRISHTTIQLEVTPCAPVEASHLYCMGAKDEDGPHSHDHRHDHDDHGHHHDPQHAEKGHQH